MPSNITIKQLRGFVAIAGASSFAEASEHLHLSQPALSSAIRNLEDAVGGRLFIRSTRSVALTPEGAAFLPVARRLLDDWQGGFDDLCGLFALQRGKLSIAAMPSFASNCLPGVMAQFYRQYPNVNINVQDIVMEDVIDAVKSGRVELGITFQSDGADGLDFESLFNDRFIAILPPKHPLTSATKMAFSDLFCGALIALNRGSSTRRWIDKAIAASAHQPTQIFEAYQLTTVGSMVAAGLGVAVVPALCQRQMQALGAVCRPIAGTSIERRVGLFTHRRRPLSSAAQQMVKLLVTQTYQID